MGGSIQFGHKCKASLKQKHVVCNYNRRKWQSFTTIIVINNWLQMTIFLLMHWRDEKERLGWEKIGIAKTFTLDFQVATMLIDALPTP